MSGAPPVVIVNYGMGNLRSVANALDFLRVPWSISSDPAAVRSAAALILPGVGAFGEAMKRIGELGLEKPLGDAVRAGTPFLGICLGMQLLAEDSTERGFHRGLGLVKGHVERLEAGPGAKVPHVGWNAVEHGPETPLFRGLSGSATFYFDHSFHLKCDRDLVTGVVRYGDRGDIVASIRRENVFATQFHPEKSHHAGLRVLRNFTRQAFGSEARP